MNETDHFPTRCSNLVVFCSEDEPNFALDFSVSEQQQQQQGCVIEKIHFIVVCRHQGRRERKIN